MDEKDKKPYSVKTLKDFFGVRPGESIKDFGKELTALSEEEKTALTKGIEDESFDY